MARTYEEIGELDRVKVGDWALHVSGNLDSRPVTRIEHHEDGTHEVWLGLGPEPVTAIGPLPAENYTFTRIGDE